MLTREIELKFRTDSKTLAALMRHDRLKAGLIGEPKRRRLETIYFDTEDQALAGAGLALRIRRVEGRPLMSIKWSTGGAGLSRQDYEVSLVKPVPDIARIEDPPLRKILEKRIKGRALKELFRTRLWRASRRLMNGAGDIVEIASDRGELLTATKSQEIAELELELIAGQPSALFEIARPLAQDFPLTLSLQSKADRGWSIAADRVGDVRRAGPIDFPPGTAVNAAIAEIAGHCLRHLSANAELLQTARVPEAAHQCRVALRRLRSSFGDFAERLPWPHLARLADDAKAFAGALAPVRDLDVFTSEILEPVAASLGASASLALIAREVEEKRQKAWSSVPDLMRGASWRLFLLDLAELALGAAQVGSPAALDPPADELTRSALTKRYKKAIKYGERFAELTVEERHDFRKALKRLRYTSEFYASLHRAKDARKFIAALAELQDDLGLMNDVAAARASLAALADERGGGGNAAEAAFAAGEIVGWHAYRAAKAEARIARDFKRFQDVAPFWRAS